MIDTMPETITAAMLVIGNEILSGHTKDENVEYIAKALMKLGIRLFEVRLVRDEESAIIEAVTALANRYTYVFTSGGIGSTHDDITTASIAKAFGIPIKQNIEVMRLLSSYYASNGVEFNVARQKMAELPVGATLIKNPVSVAPGFIVKNVHVMPGMPDILRAMFDGLKLVLNVGAVVHSRTVSCMIGEGVIANDLAKIQATFPDIEIGSYPHLEEAGILSTSLVLSGTDQVKLEEATEVVRRLVHSSGG
ncbi:putative nucleotide-utilizing enzyme/competence-damage associated protein [Candidatus Endolissoclinum faulkneri L5]|uniref:Putative nucleotide-utilizing enzyme/competence-damage associated protein n=1 Tax=Candidatus Endolissoclinum faulkneri L5 TaxID=1401328 RepID=V9TW32_9PROT|nr:molybdopterin-binding protein [Candidatus Endolissoclinum faulkneri]AHC73913.1 putative nucleotide-utilizing enzyme/competence-damage associated protein [Candidatus Endolissoclinum faulkneri L5]